ncbi:dynactin 4 [Geosmithia morbida]|uniref:Dynactin subunit 4 n=1 Tax=Geosmithia morbida TaxID=1094350 RepID=A0A9P4YNU8_9HYPO|nr:dynactin 4 [Geosmithia morbida]KAF4119320.1 dynactin 4 [Geosmithia morbida]
MALSIPYTYIQCPCSERSIIDGGGERSGNDSQEEAGDSHDDDHTFDPRAPRSNYSLFPLEYLLYCEDCQEIRCPRCVNEEVVTYYCPNCLFEVPSSNLRSDGNRCTRNCYQCPVCASPVQVGEVQTDPDPTNLLGADNGTSNAPVGPFALFCQYCTWSSSDIGLEFDRPSGIASQLNKLRNGGEPRITARDVRDRRKDNPDHPPVPDELVDTELQFSSLKSFYQTQLAEASGGLGRPGGNLSLGGGAGFSSPAALSRIMSLYTTGRGNPNRLNNGPPDVMREALTTDDGLKMAQLDESAAVKKLLGEGWDGTVSREQRLAQVEPSTVRFQDDLRPSQCVLRTKRSKRCAVCRHIISKPENKVASTRFKIRLVAKSYIPTMTIRPLQPTSSGIPVGSRPDASPEMALKPLQPYQYILTFVNPLFDRIRVTLAAPNSTPGRFSSKVTLLCPQFEISANTDMWDDALREDSATSGSQQQQPEAGKIYDRGRNWVSIVLEVIPPSLRPEALPSKTSAGKEVDKGPLKPDEDILEIPMFVHMEWEAEAQHDVGAVSSRDRDGSEKRELAYWCALGVGRISQE